MFHFDNNAKRILQLKVYHSEYKGTRARKFVAIPMEKSSTVSPSNNGEGECSNDPVSPLKSEFTIVETAKEKTASFEGVVSRESQGKFILEDEDEFNALMNGPKDDTSSKQKLVRLADEGVDANTNVSKRKTAAFEGVVSQESQGKFILEDEDEFNALMNGPKDDTSSKQKLVRPTDEGVDANTNVSKRTRRKLALHSRDEGVGSNVSEGKGILEDDDESNNLTGGMKNNNTAEIVKSKKGGRKLTIVDE